MRYQVSNMEMSYIYNTLLYDYGIYEFPQIMVFEKLENKSKILRYVFDDGRSIIYIKKDKKMVDTLLNELLSPKAKCLPAYEYMFHPLSDETVARLVFVCMQICEMLEISLPQLEFRKNLEQYGISIAEINLICLQAASESENDVLYTIRYMAHELRHLWQYKNRPEYFSKPQHKLDDEGKLNEYLFSLAENDAEAFANKLFREITGFDSVRGNPNYAGGNIKVREMVLKAEEEIELDKKIVGNLRRFLGFE